MKASTDVTIHDDRTADVVLEVVPDRQSWIKGGTEVDLDGLVRLLDVAAPEGVVIERIDTDRSSGLRVTWDSVPLEDLTQVFRFGDEADAVALQLFQTLEVSSEDDVWEVNAALAPVRGSSALAAVGVADDLTGADVSLRIALPGRITSTNATEHDRSSATWTVDATSSESTTLFVRSEPGLGLSPAWWLVVGLVALMVVGGVLVVAADRARVHRSLRRAASAAATSRAGQWAPAPSNSPPVAAATEGVAQSGTAPRGMYQDVTGDDSIALPVGGRSWGRAPDPSATHGVARSVAPLSGGFGGDNSRDTTDVTAASGTTSGPLADGAAGGGLDAAADAASRSSPAPVPPGWYPDPDRPDGRRFWDGQAWTDHRS